MSKKKKPKTIVIVCEGQTEINYFNEIRNDIRNNHVKVVPPKDAHGTQTAKKFIDMAWKAYWAEVHDHRMKSVAKKHQIHPDDEVWCVFDKDKKSIGEMHKFIKLANDYGFRVICSLPAFELWLYLHFADFPSSENALRLKLKQYNEHTLLPKLMTKMLQDKWPQYHKGRMTEESQYMSVLRNKEDKAIQRAKNMKKRASDDGLDKFTYPFTDVDVLVERLRKL